ncbi:integumentary mucin C.1-like [Dreissena polymorpha]|uniref:integumentary mucin C.1-like n=1 Tax=Dreissena polymorpha TaxID=45954 RepID=UPI00226568D8|nr:integumentary mucin C.1-like [Dreissena polymorpha]
MEQEMTTRITALSAPTRKRKAVDQTAAKITKVTKKRAVVVSVGSPKVDAQPTTSAQTTSPVAPATTCIAATPTSATTTSRQVTPTNATPRTSRQTTQTNATDTTRPATPAIATDTRPATPAIATDTRPATPDIATDMRPATPAISTPIITRPTPARRVSATMEPGSVAHIRVLLNRMEAYMADQTRAMISMGKRLTKLEAAVERLEVLLASRQPLQPLHPLQPILPDPDQENQMP